MLTATMLRADSAYALPIFWRTERRLGTLSSSHSAQQEKQHASVQCIAPTTAPADLTVPATSS